MKNNKKYVIIKEGEEHLLKIKSNWLSMYIKIGFEKSPENKMKSLKFDIVELEKIKKSMIKAHMNFLFNQFNGLPKKQTSSGEQK